MSDRPSGNPDYRGHERGLPVVSAPSEAAAHPADEAHLARVRRTEPATTGWSPTAWRAHRRGGAE